MGSAPPPIPKDAAPGSRYERLVKIASGGMATVYVGRLRGALGFEQLVALKRPHPHVMQLPDFRHSLIAEARLASRIRHANVVGVRDVEMEDDSVLLVMDYVEGASLHELLSSARGTDRMPRIRVGMRVIRDLCAGLQAVHDLTDDEDRPLGAVHRDVSPQNVLVGLDGVARLADFGIAKCLYTHETSTGEGILKGKIQYMAPEYMAGARIDQRSDIFAVGVMLWEILTNRRLFKGENSVAIINKVLRDRVPLVSEVVPELGDTFDALVGRALARNPAGRFERASDLGAALDATIARSDYAGTHDEVARFVRDRMGPRLLARKQRIKDGLRSISVPDVPATPLVVAREPGPPLPLPLELTMSPADTARLPDQPRPRAGARLSFTTFALVVAVAFGGLTLTGTLARRPNRVAARDSAEALPSSPTTFELPETTSQDVVDVPASASATLAGGLASASAAPSPSVRDAGPRPNTTSEKRGHEGRPRQKEVVQAPSTSASMPPPPPQPCNPYREPCPNPTSPNL
ncbi:serine/threonine protein kinase [Pendulispora albinea]|uniref:Serine/threonine protein kinase n=1 Tax=Pendulispora albinea TaxID=2741071 RepID=A0ABZ2M837_9BACT